MHQKHYHPSSSQWVAGAPNVADLAYARTVEGLLMSPGGAHASKHVVVSKHAVVNKHASVSKLCCG